MKIKTKKETIDFVDYFKTVEELKKFISEKNKFINADNLNDKFMIVYNKLKESEAGLKSNILDWHIIKQFEFKFKRPVRLEFWEERGYGIKEFNEYNAGRIIGNQHGKKQNSIEGLKSFNEINNFKYGKFKFTQQGRPKCNLCKCNLNLGAHTGKYLITSCSNDSCASNFTKELGTIRQLAFLPLELFHKKNKKIKLDSRVHKEHWLLNGYSIEQTNAKILEIKKELNGVLKNSARYYEISLGLTKQDAELRMKRQSHLSIDGMMNRGFSLDESIIEIKKKQIINKDSFLKKKKENPGAYSAYTESQSAYWVNKGFTDDEAREKVSDRQSTFSLEKCIEKYGEEKGIKIFTERQEKWQKSLNENGNLKIGYSKISQELFCEILEYYTIEDKLEVYFAIKNEEFRIKRDEGGVWMYDFTDLKRKKIIEFHGDMYHGNPKKYLAEDFPHPFRKSITAKEMWDKDKRKKELAEQKGFEVLVVWDSEYRWGNKQNVINKCLEFL